MCVQWLQQPGEFGWYILHHDPFAAGSSQKLGADVDTGCVQQQYNLVGGCQRTQRRAQFLEYVQHQRLRDPARFAPPQVVVRWQRAPQCLYRRRWEEPLVPKQDLRQAWLQAHIVANECDVREASALFAQTHVLHQLASARS